MYSQYIQTILILQSYTVYLTSNRSKINIFISSVYKNVLFVHYSAATAYRSISPVYCSLDLGFGKYQYILKNARL